MKCPNCGGNAESRYKNNIYCDYCGYDSRKKLPEYSCDQWINRKKSRCRKKPYCEVFVTRKHSWSYLCRWHYILDTLYCKLLRIKTHGYYILDEDDENVDNIPFDGVAI